MLLVCDWCVQPLAPPFIFISSSFIFLHICIYVVHSIANSGRIDIIRREEVFESLIIQSYNSGTAPFPIRGIIPAVMTIELTNNDIFDQL